MRITHLTGIFVCVAGWPHFIVKADQMCHLSSNTSGGEAYSLMRMVLVEGGQLSSDMKLLMRWLHCSCFIADLWIYTKIVYCFIATDE